MLAPVGAHVWNGPAGHCGGGPGGRAPGCRVTGAAPGFVVRPCRGRRRAHRAFRVDPIGLLTTARASSHSGSLIPSVEGSRTERSVGAEVRALDLGGLPEAGPVMKNDGPGV